MKSQDFNKLPTRSKWAYSTTMSDNWYCPGCHHQTDKPTRATGPDRTQRLCGNCDHELTRRTPGGQSDPFNWNHGKIQPAPFHELPNGTIIKRQHTTYCLHQGLDHRVLVNVNTGTWTPLEEINWRTYKILYTPPQD